MELDRSWSAVFDPGKATDFFASPSRPALSATVGSPWNDGAWNGELAWWCSEMARTIYRRDARAQFFAAVGLTEQRVFAAGGTRGALVVTDELGFLVFRGTDELRDWVTNLRVAPAAWPDGGVVHQGFARAFDAVRPEVEDALRSCGVPVLATGHSLGGALATLAASRFELAAAYSFGAPRVGDGRFWNTLRCTLHRVVHGRDIVPTLPPKGLGYVHGGEHHHLGLPPDGGSPSEPSRCEDRALDRTRWFEPSPPVSDHAPINYSKWLHSAIRIA